MKVQFNEYKAPEKGAWVVGILENKKMTQSAEVLDKLTNGVISHSLKENKFSGKVGEVLEILSPSCKSLSLSRILLVGVGKTQDLSPHRWEVIGGHVAPHLQKTLDKEVTFHFESLGNGLSDAEQAAYLGAGMVLRSWRFDKYKTKEKEEDKPHLKTLTLITSDKKKAEKTFDEICAITEGVLFTRSVVTEPSNVLNPPSMGSLAEELKHLGLEVEILGLKEMKKLGMGALLGVAQGSDFEPKMIILQWKGGKKGEKPVAFVGKGVTFDSGGLSLKPADGMEEMKYDMAGSAVVAGTMIALAKRKAKVNAVGVMGMVENMPSGKAQRPGDVVTSLSGQTIEVLNTDAEGRLVLADALWYTQDRFKPDVMIDLATLTGAIVVALGSEYAGLFSNTPKLTDQLVKAGKTVDEKLWPMPMGESYNKIMDSAIADMKNISGMRSAGVSTSATFLERFVNKTPWAHLDIAGVTWSSKDKPLSAKGATGFGVRLLNQFVEDIYENS
jgi:leucyl aminopeptidase